MSSNNNSEANSFAVMATIIAVAAVIAAAVLAAILTFLAVILTIAAFLAWDAPLRIGKWTLMPQEAHAFIYRGLIGAVLVPIFLVFVQGVFSVPIEWDWLGYYILGGYVAGSIGIEIVGAQNDDEPVQYIEPSHQIPNLHHYEPPRDIPFDFASWDDEEKR